ncbi:MAG: ArsB/NhaD family transporter [Spirochaetia bacterium]|nr:ArsB/NhaD family transporter [Spirochaetia bacterium]
MALIFTALIIFAVIYIFISTEWLNKTVVALFGASVYMILRIIDSEAAYAVIDWNVIFLLISMMIIVSITKDTGIFQYVAVKAAKMVKGEPLKILILLSLITAVFSSFLDNVTTVLIIAPVTILIAVELGISPVPFIINIAIASNIGGTATLIGDPPNIMIGSKAGFDFLKFIIVLGPLVLVLLVLFSCILWFFYRKKLRVSTERKARILEFDESRAIEDRKLLIKCISVLVLVIVGFLFHGLLHLEASVISLFGASLLMIISGRKDVDAILKDIEWGTIMFFMGLFILVGGLVETGVIKMASEKLLAFTTGNVEETSFIMIWASGIFSSVVDNIPYVATMIPMVSDMEAAVGSAAIAPVWWALAIGSCLGGNGTLVGASANVVAAGIAGKSGYKISFWEFTKYSFLIMIFTLIVSSVYIKLLFF